MPIRLIGDVELSADGVSVPIGPARRRTVLAALAVDAGRSVPADVLIERVWGSEPPAEVRANLYAHISHLRRALRAADPATAIESTGRGNGYRLCVDPEQVDAHRFLRLIAETRGPDDPATRAATLHEALGLWRGTPLAGLDGAWIARYREGLVREYLAATARWAHAALRLGRAAEVVSELRAPIERHPTAEPLAEVLMVALDDSGRSVEALAFFAAFRRRLVDELGTEPGDAVRAAHEAILRGTSHGRAATARPRGPVPAQMPGDAAHFVGRVAELARLDAVGAAEHKVVVLHGSAGIGKSSLALRWAQRARATFDGGQLYADLGAHRPGRAPSTTEVLSGFVRALGIAAAETPADEAELVALYRSLTAAHRVLVVLDDVRDSASAIPLLLGPGPSMLVLTSRDPLVSMRALHDVPAIRVDVPSAGESLALLRRLLGRAATDDELRQVVEACAGLPLALRIAAANLAERTGHGVAGYLRRLRCDPLGELEVPGDDRSGVRSVFAAAYAALPPPAGAVLGLLGAAPGPDISLPALAALVDADETTTRRHVAELLRAGLCDQTDGPRIRLHDLLRQFAGQLAVERPDAALHRLYSHYHRTALAATAATVPGGAPLTHDDAVAGARPLTFDDRESAAEWLRAELPNLVAVGAHAAGTADATRRSLSGQIADAVGDHLLAHHLPRTGEHDAVRMARVSRAVL